MLLKVDGHQNVRKLQLKTKKYFDEYPNLNFQIKLLLKQNYVFDDTVYIPSYIVI